MGAPLATLTARLPPSWRLTAVPADARALTLRAPDGRTARLTVVHRTRLSPRDVVVLRADSRGGLDGTLVTAPFLSSRARDLLKEAGASYADATGNVRLVVNRPGIYVETEGALKDPSRETRTLASLKGPAAARVVRALCDFSPPYGVRHLAAIAETAAASVSRVVALLGREALVERGARNEISDVDWAALLKRWTQDYQVLSSNDAGAYLEPRGTGHLIEKLRALADRAAVTGSLAAARRAPVAPARMAMVYVDDPAATAGTLGLRPAEAGGNVMLVRPLDRVVFARTWMEDGVTYVALSQVVADLLTSPGRGPAEGEELLDWMKKNTGAWRA